MNDKNQGFIIGVVVTIIIFMLGFWCASYFQSESEPTVDETIPSFSSMVISGYPRGMFEGYITDISPITGEIKIMVPLDMFVNPPKAIKEVTVKVESNTIYRTVIISEETEETEEIETVEMVASFEDFKAMDNVMVAITGDITRLLSDETITIRSITRFQGNE